MILIFYSNTNEAKKIHMLTEQARNTSLEAYNLAKKAIATNSNMTYVLFSKIFFIIVHTNVKR